MVSADKPSMSEAILLVRQVAATIEKLTFHPTDVLFVHLGCRFPYEGASALQASLREVVARACVTVPVCLVEGQDLDFRLLPCAAMNKQGWFHRTQLETCLEERLPDEYNASALRDLLTAGEEAAGGAPVQS